MTDFSVPLSNSSLLGYAEPMIPWDAHGLDLRRRRACWNFRNFTDVDRCNVA